MHQVLKIELIELIVVFINYNENLLIVFIEE